MAKRNLDEVKNWLVKSKRDIDAARKLGVGDEPIFSSAIFHCQQAAEKAIKAVLCYFNEPIPKAHDIGKLIGCAAKHVQDIDSRIAERHLLTRYAEDGRYSDETFTLDDFKLALQNAQGFYEYILSILPPEVQPRK